MKQASKASSYSLYLLFVRSSISQVFYEESLIKGMNIYKILEVSAAPGYSEHHSGRALDITTPGYAVLEEEFEHSPAFEWLCEHAPGFGFSLSFPRDNPHGVIYEPWHWAWRI